MGELDIISAIEQAPCQVKLSGGTYTVRPLTVRRLAKLAAMLKDIQGDPKKFKDMDSPEFHGAVADMLVATGENMPKALGLVTGDEELGKLEDVSLLDLTAIIEAAIKVNKAAQLFESFRKAMEALNGTAQK